MPTPRNPVPSPLRLAALVAVVAMTPPIGAQPAPTVYKRLTTAEGLSQVTVQAIHRDRRGFVWLGTYDGLNRFDGYDVATYFAVPGDSTSLGGNSVPDIAETADGALWIATDRGGLSRYDPTRDAFTRLRHDPDNDASLPSNRVFEVHVGPRRQLWAGTSNGLCRVDPATGRVERFRGHPLGGLAGVSITGFTVTRAGAVWAQDGDGAIVRWEPGARALARYPADGSPGAPVSGAVHTVYEDGQGVVWIGHRGGLSRYDPARDAFTRVTDALPYPHVREIIAGPDGAPWAALYGGGVVRLDPATGVPTPLTGGVEVGVLPTPDLMALHVDRAGIVWAGTVGYGAAFSAARSGPFTAYAPASLLIDARIVRDFAEAGGRVWVATAAGVAVADPASRTYRPAAPGCLGAVFPRALAADSRGRLWAGFFWEGICVYDPATGASFAVTHDAGDPASLSSQTVYGVATDDRWAWAGTGAGLDRIDLESGWVQRVRLGRTPPTVYHVVTSRAGGVWAGTSDRGVYRVTAGGAVRHISADEFDAGALDSPAVYSLLEAADDALWVGTDAGLNRLDPATGRITRFGAAQGLPPGTVNGVLEDADGRIWASTNRGLARLDRGARRFVVYDAEDGLPFTEFAFTAAHRLRSGTLLFGGVQGFVAVRPDRLGVPRPPPAVVLTALDVYGSDRDPAALWAARSVRLGAAEDGFAVSFAALDVLAPRKVRYAYRLDGFDDEWIEAGTRRVASYAGLPPGAYTLRVRAANADGVWTAEATTLSLIRLPHWWQTAWARLLALAALVALGVATYRWRVQQLLAVETSRRQIADDLHDDVGSRVSALALAVELSSRQPAVPAEERDRLTGLAATARDVVADLRDTVWVIDGGSDTLGGLVERVRQVADRMLVALPHRVVVPETAPVGSVPLATRRDVLFVVKEALHNVVRHAEASAVEVRVEVGASWLTVKVTDDGRGLPAHVEAGGRGLATMRARADRLDGRLDIGPGPDGGTRVTLQVPFARRARQGLTAGMVRPPH